MEAHGDLEQHLLYLLVVHESQVMWKRRLQPCGTAASSPSFSFQERGACKAGNGKETIGERMLRGLAAERHLERLDPVHASAINLLNNKRKVTYIKFFLDIYCCAFSG